MKKLSFQRLLYNYDLKERRHCLTLCPGYNKCPLLDKPWRYFPKIPLRTCPLFSHLLCISSDVADLHVKKPALKSFTLNF